MAVVLGDTVESLQDRMSSREFTNWQAYLRIEPYGYPIDEWRWGMLAASICNSVLSTIPIPAGKKRPKFYKPTDFYSTRQPQSELTDEQRKHLERKRKKKRG